ncbi:MAG: ATP-dependent Clp protease adaptor ClpS [Treponema sp.]|jgi:ATP-dependent Clp protease adaptor protein ClpS|nr:ATP-dependent Clp protease adaptor ClpS [Treponema sp.]
MAENRGNGTKLADRSEEKLREPEDFRVILLNDNYTTMEFVVDVLMTIFQKNGEEANRIMMDVHRKGQGIVGLYPWDIALTKAEQVHSAAAQKEFPLRCIVEQV